MTGRPPTAAGAILALAIVAGAIVGGVFFHEGSAGMVIGFGVGIALAVVLWLRERRRIGR